VDAFMCGLNTGCAKPFPSDEYVDDETDIRGFVGKSKHDLRVPVAWRHADIRAIE